MDGNWSAYRQGVLAAWADMRAGFDPRWLGLSGGTPPSLFWRGYWALWQREPRWRWYFLVSVASAFGPARSPKAS